MSDHMMIAEQVRQMTHIFHTRTRGEILGYIGALNLDQAYRVQEGFVADRARTSGNVIGWKVGCTSAAIRRQFGLEQPISGRLFEREIRPDGSQLTASEFVDCAVEPELVFRLGEDLEGDVTVDRIFQAMATIAVGIEFHNYRFWHGAPTSQELIASNGLHAGLVIGPELPWAENLDFDLEKASLLVDQKLVVSAPCSETMGGPLHSVQWLAQHAASRGRKLRAGELIIPGSAVELVRVQAGQSIEARFSTLGSCRARLV